MRCLERLAACGAVALGLVAAPAAAHAQAEPPLPEPSRFQKVLLEDDLGQTVRFDVAKDGRVITIQRQGGVRVWDPVAKDTVLAGTVPATAAGETGLMGLALAPDFDTTGHIYLNYAMPGFSTTASPNFRRQRTSRFTLSDSNVLDLASEKPIYDSINAGGGGHSGGDLEMTPDGILFITTGDNTNCCAALGWAPLDERPGQAGGDAQRTSAQHEQPERQAAADQADGGSGRDDRRRHDLHDPGGEPVRRGPGHRRTRRCPRSTRWASATCSRIGDYDPVTKAIWIGDYGPDAPIDSERGPRGYVRGLLVTEAANYGWPYCTANNIPYADWDFATSTPRGVFNCAAPVNDSPNNTGLRNLPPIKPANLYYSYAAQPPWPNLYGGGLHAGPRYVYDASNPSPTKFPEWFDGRRFLLEFTSNFIASLRFGSDLKTPEDVQLFQPSWEFGAPFDARFGPDGSLYLLEYGSNSFSSTKLSPALSRIDYVAGNRTPAGARQGDPRERPDAAGRRVRRVGVERPRRRRHHATRGTSTVTAPRTRPRSRSRTGSPAAGSYTPRLTVTDANGASSVFNLTITRRQHGAQGRVRQPGRRDVPRVRQADPVQGQGDRRRRRRGLHQGGRRLLARPQRARAPDGDGDRQRQLRGHDPARERRRARRHGVPLPRARGLLHGRRRPGRPGAHGHRDVDPAPAQLHGDAEPGPVRHRHREQPVQHGHRRLLADVPAHQPQGRQAGQLPGSRPGQPGRAAHGRQLDAARRLADRSGRGPLGQPAGHRRDVLDLLPRVPLPVGAGHRPRRRA